MINRKTVVLQISDLRETFYVRTRTDENHVLMLADLYENGAQLPPLKVVEDTLEIVDGRHRKRALEFLDRKEVTCILVDEKDRPMLLAEGLISNVGGSLPPEKWDIVLTFQQMIESGASQRQIIELFKKQFPASLVRAYLKDATSEIAKKKLRDALNAVVNGSLTVPQAAEKYKVDPAKLKEEIQGKRRTKRQTGAKDLKAKLSTQFKSNNFRTSRILRGVVSKCQDGDITLKQARDIFDHTERLLKRGQTTCADLRKRFEASMKEE